MTHGVPAQDLPENQDKDVRHTMLHATNQKIELDEKGNPTVEIGSDGFPKEKQQPTQEEQQKAQQKAERDKPANKGGDFAAKPDSTKGRVQEPKTKDQGQGR